MQHWNQHKERLRYILTRTSTGELLPHLKLAIFSLQHEPIDPFTEERLRKCLASDDVAWMKYVILMTACCSVHFRDLIPRSTFSLSEWVDFVRTQFMLYLCGTQDRATKKLIYGNYRQLVSFITSHTIEL